MASTVQELLGSYDQILESAVRFTQKYGLPLEGFEIDHLCFRCDSKSQYQSVCKGLTATGVGSLLIETMIADRPISIITLSESIKYGKWSISCLEITCPKAGRAHRSGFEHLEVVIDQDNSHGFHNCRQYLTEFAGRFPSVSFDFKAVMKDVNADICISTDEGYSIKYHARPIYEVCQYEKDSNHFVPVPTDYFN